jgi:hypothetical protein
MEPKREAPNEKLQDLADDMLSGAEEIAEFLFGDRASRRKVYYLVECTRIPIFRIGSGLRARRSVLLSWIEGQEGRATSAIATGSRE